VYEYVPCRKTKKEKQQEECSLNWHCKRALILEFPAHVAAEEGKKSEIRHEAYVIIDTLDSIRFESIRYDTHTMWQA